MLNSIRWYVVACILSAITIVGCVLLWQYFPPSPENKSNAVLWFTVASFTIAFGLLAARAACRVWPASSLVEVSNVFVVTGTVFHGWVLLKIVIAICTNTSVGTNFFLSCIHLGFDGGICLVIGYLLYERQRKKIDENINLDSFQQCFPQWRRRKGGSGTHITLRDGVHA